MPLNRAHHRTRPSAAAPAQLVFVVNFFWSLCARRARRPTTRGRSGTLEWTVASPPPHHNFDVIPTVLHGPHEFNHPQLVDKDWLGQAEALPGERP